jgi:hypothetical protein
MLEGILAQTLYGTAEFALPVTISWTGLAWHALISVLAGWYAVRKTLLRNDCRRTIAVASLLGIFYGAWAFLWSLEPGHRVMVLVGQGSKDVALVHFALYAFLTTALLILSYWVYNAAEPAAFRPSPLIASLLGAVAVAYFALTVVRVRPLASLLLPVLLGVVYGVLRKNRASRPHRDLISGLCGRARVSNYLCLLFMPLVASALYGLLLAVDVRIPTGVFVLVASTCAGAVMFGVSLVMVLRNGRERHNVDTGTAR